jgi:hypothetical protein
MTTAETSPSPEVVGAVTQQKTTYRKYVSWKTTDDGQGNITRNISGFSVVSESDKKEPDKIKVTDKSTGVVTEVPNPYAGQPVSFANAEREELELFSENDVILYDVKSFEGAEFLIPDPAIRLYIFRRGLSTFQTALANGLMKSYAEGTTDTPEFNGITVDLRVGTDEEGTYSINKAPARRAMTLDDKLYKVLIAAGKTDAEARALIAVINATSASVAVAEQEEVEIT